MSLNHLGLTLERIREIENRLGVAPPSEASSSGADFGTVLSQVQSGGDGGDNSPLRGQINEIIQKQALAQGMDPSLVKAVVQAESGFNPEAVSPVGAQGLMQLMPGTADSLGVNDSFNPEENVKGGTKYLKGLLQKYQSEPLALAAYNAGPGAVDKYHGVPPYKETQNYVKRVLNLKQIYSQHAEGTP